MTESDFSINYTGLGGAIQLFSSLTNNAQPNSEFEVHTHYNEFEVYYFLQGDLYFSFEGKRYCVEEGSMIIIANGMLHRPIIKNSCRYYRKRILFTKEIFGRFNISDFELYSILLKRKLLIVDSISVEKFQLGKIFEEIEQSLSLNTLYEDYSSAFSLLTLLIKAEKNSISYNFNQHCVYSTKTMEIIKFIDENLSEDLSYKKLSQHFFMSEKNLYKFFKKETGFTLGNYINERRIIKAQSLLNAGESACVAALNSGFCDYSVFYRSFLRKVGITPMEYIKNLK
ncbi:MAG: AraC family transcriptional regulator [Ruminococcaceae bacterium]|nr:AraC family transcriptional regulator [Oscillospiraceae bacterium]